VGANIMGVFSLIRLPSRVVVISVRSIAATAGMLVLPCMMRPTTPSVGSFALYGIARELIGATATQVARIYMGQHFGLLPANRGILTRGAFALVRHPSYMGWLTMCAGYFMTFPSARNAVLIAVALPFMMWRIEQEEILLTEDPKFVAYRNRVRYRLVPGLI
jgi:protein-S-isoprenylcysteine O-methyltransferase Ste14